MTQSREIASLLLDDKDKECQEVKLEKNQGKFLEGLILSFAYWMGLKEGKEGVQDASLFLG